MNQTVNPLQQLCEVGICTATGTNTVLSSLVAFRGREPAAETTVLVGSENSCFLRIVSHRPAPGVGPSFCESYNIVVYKNPNCCFDLYNLTLKNYRSITMFKTLIDSTCFKYFLRYCLQLSVINTDDIIV